MNDRPHKLRLDELILQRGLVQTRSQAQRCIMAGEVHLGDETADKPGRMVSVDADVALRQRLRYVSRGGLKLAEALEAFSILANGWICADIGASTGGFTDCLLQSGAAKVYAIDVGYGQLAWPLRQDSRVIVMERANIRFLAPLPEPVQLVTVDVSFIGLEMVFPKVREMLAHDGQVIALIKPQFEVGRGQVGKGGVVRDVGLRLSAVRQVLLSAAGIGLTPRGVIRSPIRGPAGNVEYLGRFRPGNDPQPDSIQIDDWLAELER